MTQRSSSSAGKSARKVPTNRPVEHGIDRPVDLGGRPVVVVLGPGRSGTSLCAKILGRLGIRMEATLQRANEMNPDGYFEDARLDDLNKRLLKKLAPVPGFGPREAFAPALIADEEKELFAHIKERAFAEPEIWGFKNPRTSLLLPFYRRAFQAVGIVPRYVFCARAPGAVAESLREAANTTREKAERVYFLRSFLALRDCAANCHVIHYERLLKDPVVQIERLWTHVRVGDAPCPLSVKDREELVDFKLNRSALRAKPVTNPLAGRIGKLLDSMEGTEFDRDAVLSELREINGIHSVYQAWLDQADQAGRQSEQDSRRIADLQDEIEALRADVQVQVESSAEMSARADKAEKQAADLARRSEHERTDLARDLDEAHSQAARQETCADVLSAEVSALQAETARLGQERNAAVVHARSCEGTLAVQRNELEKARRQLKLAQSREAALQQKQEEIQYRLERQIQDLKANLLKVTAARDKAATKAAKLAGSVKLRVGTLIADAVQRPGLRTLTLPWDLARVRSTGKLKGESVKGKGRP